jgi:hypothetical protein
MNKWQRQLKHLLLAALLTTDLIWLDLGSKPGHRGGKPATNHLRYGMATVLSTDIMFLLYYLNI